MACSRTCHEAPARSCRPQVNCSPRSRPFLQRVRLQTVPARCLDLALPRSPGSRSGPLPPAREQLSSINEWLKVIIIDQQMAEKCDQSARIYEEEQPKESGRVEPFIGEYFHVHLKMRHRFILSGYRVNFHSTKQILRSLFMVHNETVNIWLHLGFFLVVLAALGYVHLVLQPSQAVWSFVTFLQLCARTGMLHLQHLSNLLVLYGGKSMEMAKNISESNAFNFMELNPEFDHSVSRLPIIGFLCGAALCLGSSAVYHLFLQKSLRAEAFFLRLDYAGINFLISGTTIPAVYYNYYCSPHIANFFCTLSVTFACLLFGASLTDYLHDDRRRTLKVLLYGGFGVLSAFPILINQQDPNDPFQMFLTVPLYLGMGASYLLGLTIYAVRCPERYRPGHYDICGHSHQIWHLAVVVGIVLAYIATIINYYQRQLYPTCSLN